MASKGVVAGVAVASAAIAWSAEPSGIEPRPVPARRAADAGEPTAPGLAAAEPRVREPASPEAGAKGSAASTPTVVVDHAAWLARVRGAADGEALAAGPGGLARRSAEDLLATRRAICPNRPETGR